MRQSQAEGAELQFWRNWFRSKGEISGPGGPEEFARRFSGGPISEPQIESRIRGRSHIRILDVGAGPATFLGREHNCTTVDIVATDLLAPYYDAFLREFDLSPPIRSLPISGEELHEHFPMGSFDFCYARNALDHAERPTLCILNMIGLLKPGGWLVLRHHPNEGQANVYAGMHQWNFDCDDGDLLLSSQKARMNLTALYRELCPIHAFLDTPRIWCVAIGRRAGAQT